MGLNTREGTSGHSCCPELWGPAFPLLAPVAVATAASPLSPCLCATEEQFILAQVALLEQVDALVPMLDSASIKGTLCSHSSTLGREGGGGAKASLFQCRICSLSFSTLWVPAT